MGARASKSGAEYHTYRRRSSPKQINTNDLKLSETDLNTLVAETGLSRSQVLEIYTKFLKEADPNGELNLDHFLDLYHSITENPPEYLEENAEFIFDQFDKDHNGKVSFREFLNAFILTSPGNLQKKAEYTFELYDMDNSGFLDIEEMYRVVVRIYELLDDSQKSESDALKFAEDCMRQLDVNPKDGVITKG